MGEEPPPAPVRDLNDGVDEIRIWIVRKNITIGGKTPHPHADRPTRLCSGAKAQRTMQAPAMSTAPNTNLLILDDSRSLCIPLPKVNVSVMISNTLGLV